MGIYGEFEGEVITKWLKGKGKDRDMLLLENFTYIDQFGKRWTAMQGEKINGASIPPAFWGASFGTPFVGDYRRASVVHDVFCFSEEPHQEVHKMFYHAMRCDGVPKRKALLMYRAVKQFGPNWEADGESIINAIAPSLSDIDLMVSAIDQILDESVKEAQIEELDKLIDQHLFDR